MGSGIKAKDAYGCGGAGARKHDCYSGHTEAYMASRFCAGIFYDCFRENFPCGRSANQVTSEIIAPQIAQKLRTYAPPKDASEFQIKGSMVHTLPTTAAAALIQQADHGDILISAIWAGDSRVYLLDAAGLAQLTVDDTTVSDPMENIYEDGILRNILCSDRPVNLHCRTVCVRPPFMAFAATDGCFGYVSTPMEFEGILLNTLLTSDNIAQWEKRLANMLGAIAGDDHTLCLAGFGHSGFSDIQKSAERRYAQLKQDYLIPVGRIPVEDRQSRFQLWGRYKDNYFRYLKDGFA